MRNRNRLLAALLSLCLVLSALCLAPIRAQAADTGTIERVLCSLNFTPVALMELSYVNVSSSSTDCSITSAFWTDGSGSQVSGSFGTGSYTLNVNYAANAGKVFSANPTGYINNKADGVTVAVSEDGLSATLRKTYSAEIWAPTPVKQPTGERVEIGGWASFVVSSTYTESREWFFESPDGGQSIPAADAASKWPLVTVSGQDSDRLLVHNIPAEMNGWKVYCRHWSVGHQNYADSARATITVTNIPAPTPAAVVTPEPVLTPEPAATAEPAPDPARRSFSYSSDSASHWRVYADTGETGAPEAHLYVWHITRAAAPDQVGEETGVCSVCGQTVTRSLSYERSEKAVDLGIGEALGVEGFSDIQLLLLGGVAVCLLLLILTAAFSPRKSGRRRK